MEHINTKYVSNNQSYFREKVLKRNSMTDSYPQWILNKAMPVCCGSFVCCLVILYCNYHHGVWLLVAITGISDLFYAIVNSQNMHCLTDFSYCIWTFSRCTVPLHSISSVLCQIQFWWACNLNVADKILQVLYYMFIPFFLILLLHSPKTLLRAD